MPVRINPSILAADFANLQREIGRIHTADLVHVDVMDNHFVPNLTFGQGMVERLQQVSSLPLDVHLMIDDPDRWAPGYAEAGAFSVTFHAEAAADSVKLARRLREIGARAGIAVKPGTPVEPYLDLLAEFDQVLVMTVEPGFGGQKFIESTMPKLRLLRDAVAKSGLDLWLEVDGGVDERTIAIAADAGADTFVAGSSVFKADDPAAMIDTLLRRRGSVRRAQLAAGRICGQDRRMSEIGKTKPEIEFYDGEAPVELVTTDIQVGDGAEATPGATVDVHYVGVDLESGEEFDSSWSRGASINFPLRSLIAGWQQGIPGMRVGGRRRLIVPPHLAYGAAGSGHHLSGRTLLFVIDLLGVS